MIRRFARGSTKAGVMNKTEAAYADQLEARKIAGEIVWYKYEAVKLRLADNTFLTPDFFVMLTDGTLECHETKGGFIREDGWMKLKIAAEHFPFRFVLAQYKNKATGWSFREVGA